MFQKFRSYHPNAVSAACLAIIAGLPIMSCITSNKLEKQQSSLRGHNEPGEMDYVSLFGKLKVIPEYDKRNNVINIEYAALGIYNDGPLLKDLLNTPVERLLVTYPVPSESRAIGTQQMLEGNKNGSLKELFKLSDKEYDKIDFLYIESSFTDKTKSSS